MSNVNKSVEVVVADPEYVEVFKQGARAIDRWRTEISTINSNLKLDLSGADLSETDLTETNLNGADLRGAILSGADLSGADLVGANLTGADLSGADLCYADLSRADLSWANLHRANLREACFNGARSGNTIWAELDFSKTVGLDEVIHWGPSTIGVDTLMRSNGKIPIEFLRGCGLPDDVNAYVPTYFADDAVHFFSCYICYSQQDKTFAHQLYETLQAKGVRCWLDEKPLLSGNGNDFQRKIKAWDKILLCTSQHALTSDWVDQEIANAFGNEEQQFKKDTIVIHSLMPLNLDDHLFDIWEHKDKEVICRRVVADFRDCKANGAKFEQQVERVVTALQTVP